MNRRFLIAGMFAGLFPVTASALPVVTVEPFEHQHVYESGASGFTWYWNHLRNGSPNRDQVFQWLFVDLNIDYIRCGFKAEMEPVNDNDDPLTIDWSNVVKPPADDGNQWVFRRARLLNPDLKTMCYGFSIPPWLRSGNNLDYANPDLYAEIAEWMFINMVFFKQADGIDCDILDIYNEPDYNKFGRDHVGNLIEHVVPLLRGWVEDPERNPYGIKMPRIMAPSCLSAKVSREWLTYWHANKPNVWRNIDIVSTHQYAYADDPVNYTSVDRIRGGRDFMQSEMHTGGMTTPTTELEAATRLGKIFSCAVNGGVSVYDYYMGVSPQEPSTSLVRTPWWKNGVRRKVYFAFKQLSSMQTKGSSVVRTQIDGGGDAYQAIAYHQWGEQKTWLTVTHGDSADQLIRLRLVGPNGQPMRIESVRIYETSEERNAELVFEEETLVPSGLAIPESEYQVRLPGRCLRTFEITWEGSHALRAADDWEEGAPMAGGSGWHGDWVTEGVSSPAPVDFNRNVAVKFRGHESGEAILTRELAVPLEGDGLLRFKWDIDELQNGDRAEAQVFDGEWHSVWSVDSTHDANSGDKHGDFDHGRQQTVGWRGLGPISKIRFILKSGSSSAFFHLDDVEVVAITIPGGASETLVWGGDGAANRWVADETPNWRVLDRLETGFHDGALAVVDNSGSNTPAIEIGGSVAPSALLVDASKDYTFGGSGRIIGEGFLEKRGSGKLSFAGPHDFTGGIEIRQGVVEVNDGGALGSGTVKIESVGGLPSQLLLGNGVTLANPIVLGHVESVANQGVLGITASGMTATFSGPIVVSRKVPSGGHIVGAASPGCLDFTGPIVQESDGTILAIRDGQVRFAGGGNYQGLAVRAGHVSLGAHNGVSTRAVLSLGMTGEAIFDLNGWNQTLAGLMRDAYDPILTNTSDNLSVLTIDQGNEKRVYDGKIEGNLKLVLASGILEYDRSGSFTGGVKVENGALLIHGSLTASGVEASGGILGGRGSIAGPSIIRAGATLAPGASVGTLSFGSSLVVEGGKWQAEIDSSTGTADLVTVGGTLTIEPGSMLEVSDLAVSPVALAVGTKLAMVDYTHGSLSGIFTGLPDGASLTSGFNSFVIDYDDTSDGAGRTGRFVTLTVAPSLTGYAAWASSYSMPDHPFDEDHDGDGIPNGLEWVLGGDPLVHDAADMLSVAGSISSGLTLEFDRNPESAEVLSVEWTTDLSLGWTHEVSIGSVSSTDENGVSVSILGNRVTVLIPASISEEGRIFARLKAIPP